MSKPKNDHSLVKAFFCAFQGIKQAITAERNLKIHLLIGFGVIIAGLLVKLSISEWLIVVLLIAVVLAAEIFNHSLEELANLLNQKLDLDYDETKTCRDAAAGAVLVLALAAVIGGLLLFGPRIF